MKKPITQGADHIGLAVRDLNQTLGFFVGILGFEQVGERPEYPAVFVSDGALMITLWQVSNPATAASFNRHENIGLHHFALRVASMDTLNQLFHTLQQTPNVEVECPPQPLASGTGAHMMCIEPGGIRIEFITHAA